MSACQSSLSLFGEEDDPVRVGAAGVVGDAPYVGGLRKLLVVDQDPEQREPCIDAERNNDLVKPDGPFPDFPYLEGNPSAGPVIRYSSLNTPAMTSAHCSTVRAMVIFLLTSSASMALNQQRNQLSAGYCTMSRKGGEVTVSAMALSEIRAVCRAS